MSIETLNNQNKDLIKKDLNDLKNEIDKGQKNTKEKEVSDLIAASVVYDKFLENIAEIKNSNNPKERQERQERIKSIKDSFTEDGTIIYKDKNGGKKEIKDIEDFLNKVAIGEISINYLIDTEKYVKKGAITLEKETKNGIDYIKIKKVQLNADNIK